MATIVGIDTSKYKRFTCSYCCSIVEYAPSEDQYTLRTDEGTRIKGLNCPACHTFHRTNP